MSVLVRGRLISCINIYNLFAGHQYIIWFSLQFFGGEIWHFQMWRWRNLAEAPREISKTQDRWCVPLKYVLDILQSEEIFTVEEYKHTHTHTHTQGTHINKSPPTHFLIMVYYLKTHLVAKDLWKPNNATYK